MSDYFIYLFVLLTRILLHICFSFITWIFFVFYEKVAYMSL